MLPRLTLGDHEVTALVGGRLRLDGGAMFGVVPRPLWERVAPPDALHRVQMSSTPLLIRTPRHQIVFDLGLGDKHDARFRDRFAIESPPLPDLLAAAGVRPEEIDIVVCSHLHWDHAGGATWRDHAGGLHLTLPRATHYLQHQDWRDANYPTDRNRASYLPDDFLPLASSGRLALIAGEVTIAPGIRTVRLGGHTPGLQGLVLHTDAGSLLAINDLVPTTGHLPYPYIMGYDLEPLETLARRKELLPMAIAGDWTVAFVHDPMLTFARLRYDEAGRPAVAERLG